MQKFQNCTFGAIVPTLTPQQEATVEYAESLSFQWEKALTPAKRPRIPGRSRQEDIKTYHNQQAQTVAENLDRFIQRETPDKLKHGLDKACANGFDPG